MFTATITVTKTADVQWYSKDNSTSNVIIRNWISAQPGFVSINAENVDENTIINTTVFDSSETYHNMIFQAHSSHPEFMKRHEYNMSNNIVYDYQYAGE